MEPHTREESSICLRAPGAVPRGFFPSLTPASSRTHSALMTRLSSEAH